MEFLILSTVAFDSKPFVLFLYSNGCCEGFENENKDSSFEQVGNGCLFEFHNIVFCFWTASWFCFGRFLFVCFLVVCLLGLLSLFVFALAIKLVQKKKKNFTIIITIFQIMADKVELFNGKCGLIEGCIQRIDCSGLDFVVLEDPKLLLHYSTQWHVFASFDKY